VIFLKTAAESVAVLKKSQIPAPIYPFRTHETNQLVC
jgi:hypothetical protein